MRVSEGFIIREIAGEVIAIPSGEAARDLSGLVSLNGSGRFLFELLQTEQTEKSLTEAILQNFETDEETALTDVREFLEILRENDILIES